MNVQYSSAIYVSYLKNRLFESQLTGLGVTDTYSASKNVNRGSLYKTEALHCLKHDSKQ